jgi:hypothetical protein
MMASLEPQGEPLVSVIWNVRGQVAAGRENIEALLTQGYWNFELLLIEDTSPDDGSDEALATTIAADPRIRVVRQANASSGECLLSVLRQCRGDYIAICPTEGHFLPDALQSAVKAFDRHPRAGIVCGNNFLIDAHGKSLDKVDLITLLMTSYRPFLPAGFFRRQALLDIGLQDEGWLCETIELELCARLASDFGVVCLPRSFIDCRSPSEQDDGLPKAASSAMEERLQLIARIFSADGFWGDNEALALESKVNQVGILRAQFQALGRSDIEHLAVQQLGSIAQQFDALLGRDHRILRNLHRLFCARSHDLGLLSAPLQKLLSFSTRRKDRLAIHIPYQMWACLSGVGAER